MVKFFYVTGTASDGLCPYCKPCKDAINYEQQRDNPTAANLRYRKGRLKWKFGITVREYDAIVDSQDGRCYICRKKPTTRRLSLDHCHTTRLPIRETIRAALCDRCNRYLIGSHTDPNLFLRAAELMATWPAQKILQKVT